MILLTKNKIFDIANRLHIKFFDTPLSEKMQEFLRHLSWSFLGGIIAGIVMFVLNILAGRWLGPFEYGKYSLVVAIASIFVIPMTMGLDTAATFYIAKCKSDLEKKEYLTTSFWLLFLIIIITTFILFLYSSFFAGKVFDVQNNIVLVAIIFSVLLSFRNYFDAVIKGYHLFKLQSLLRIVEVFFVSISFLIFVIIMNDLGFGSYIKAIIAGYIFMNLAAFFRVYSNLSFNLKHAKSMIYYGFFAILGSVSGIMLNSIDKIFVNKYLGVEQLGIYNAYMTVSFILISQVTTLFINVFFPFLISIDDKGLILSKINKIFGIIFLPVFLFLYGTIYVALLFFGKQYEFNWLLALEFGLFAIISMYFTVLWWLIASKNIAGIKFTSLHGIISGLILISLMFVFRNNLNLNYAILFLIVAIFYAIIIGNLRYARIK